MGEHYSCDNSGNRVSLVECADPVAASGITLTIVTDGNDYTQTLVGGQMYIITFVGTAGKLMLASITGVTSTAANIEWVFMANVNYIFRMPLDKTTLYFEANEDTTVAYVRELAN